MSTVLVALRGPLRLALPVAAVLAQVRVALTPGPDPVLQTCVAVLLLVQAGWMLAGTGLVLRDGGPQRALATAAQLLAAGLLADVVAGAAGADLPAALGFMTGSTLASVFAFQAVLRWSRLGRGAPDAGDWVNALGSVAVLVSAGLLLAQAMDVSPAWWPAWQLVAWLGQLSIGAVLIATCLAVGVLAGMARDVRLWGVVGAYGVHVVCQSALSSGGFALTERASALGQVTICAAAVAAAQRPLPARRPDVVRPPVTSTWSLVLLGAGSLLLAVTAFSDLARTRLAATIGVAATVVTFSRVSGIVRELESLARARREARTDDLTGLANRRGLVAALASAPGTGRDRHEAALLVLDLGGFKHVNDRYGPDTGDHVLRAVAGRVADLLEGRHVLARVTGDEFAVLLPGADEHHALEVAARVADAVTQPFDVPDAVVRLGVHVGVTHVHPDEQPAPAGVELLRRGQAAMYAARAANTQVAAFDPAEDERERLRHERVEELRGLLAQDPDPACGEVVVHFQPQVDARTGAVVGAEALVRWHHPRHGLLAPVAFVDLVERHGLMAPLTRQVLRLAALEAARWAEAGFPYRVSVNLSSSSFADGDVVCLVQEALTATGLAPALLTLEITESVLMENVEAVPPVLQSLAERGVGLSIDDFGTGYSSLAYLADLPVDELKIDRSFVRRLLADPRTHAVVAGTIELARRLQLRVVAEGVEDAETLDALRALGCDVSQGYLHARPVPADEVRAWFQERTAVDQRS
ncbi:putative bifunctional diguanylate cyclase/phosphodiesterase [Aeromicrobium massiliense]|uniref:putative bifunctional diguanylate cyclase/phosphodiesterase n=1 Tax=Aeromicrobium massiliense TaxID=1464554 RepID=UPI000675D03A|nr:bifunctional diguanylate cyclase/phosphodiesterase [Aeromicrobium massiliense]